MKKLMQKRPHYAAYVRKSSEGESRQALSIPAQMDKLKEKFGDLDLEFIEDRASAFKPDNRRAFSGMLERFRKGEFGGLVVWSPDRLSRNERDAGEITYLVRSGVIKDLRFATHTFENNPEGIMFLQMALSQSQYESAKKGRDVKKGFDKKLALGMYPQQAPLGYMNDKYAERGSKTILPDPERFEKVRQILEWMASGKYTPQQILKKANEELHLTTKSGRKLTRSLLYYIFHNPFYYGEFEFPKRSGLWFTGIHTPMITKAQFLAIQARLKKKAPLLSKQPIGTFPFRGIIRCGECGASITAEKKIKRTKGGNVHHYTYYHCTKRVNENCTQKCIRSEDLEKQFQDCLEEIEIPKSLHVWAIKQLKQIHVQEIRDRAATIGAWKRQYADKATRMDKLLDLRLRDEITEEEYRERKTALQTQKMRLGELMEAADREDGHWIHKAEQCFDFAEKARAAFDTEQSETKTHILASLGSNLFLKDKILSIDWVIPFPQIRAMAKEARAISSRLEPQKGLGKQGQIEENYSSSSTMLRG